MHSILIVDDLESIHEMLDAVIQPIGYDTAFASDGDMALKKFSQGRYDIVLTDINMKPMDGLELLRQLKDIDPNVIVIMMSGYANVENATRSLKLGAFDFLTKPFKVDQLMDALKRASKHRQKAAQAAAGADASDVSSLLAGDSPRARKLREAIARHAKAHSPLLVIGELGSQKRVIASLVHQRSEAREAPFEGIDLKTADASDIEAQLVDRDGRPGALVEAAKGGALFVGNIDCLPRELHARFAALLRDLKGELRVICSTTRDLERLVEKGEFDDALYFRIATNPLLAPALRERSDDLPAIARAHLAKEGRDLTLSAQAAALLKGYRWPGNFSEFIETLDAAAAAAERGVIGEDALPDKLRDLSAWPTLAQHLDEQAAAYKGKVLAACLGDRARAAEILGCAESELD